MSEQVRSTDEFDLAHERNEFAQLSVYWLAHTSL